MTTSPSSSATRRQRGFTLIELLVSMTIGLVLIAGLGVIINRFEVSKRRNASTSDLALNTGFLAFDMDRQVRGTGSGLYQNPQAFGCQINASLGGGQILPSPAAFPAPFNGIPTAVRNIPLLAFPGAGGGGSDVLQIITGSSGMSEAPLQVNASSTTATSIQVTQSLGVRGGDLMLLTEPNRLDCMVVQAAAGYVGGGSQIINLGGNYYANVIGTTSITTFSTGGSPAGLSNLGNQAGNPPRFQLIGINANQQLVAYDMLRLNNMPGSPTTPVPLADGVVDMRVRYGIDGAQSGQITGWVVPNTGSYTTANLSQTTDPVQTLVRQIIAVRVALILRSDRIEKDVSNPGSYTLFSTLPAGMQVTVATADPNRSYKVVEFTIPVRNAILNAQFRVPPP